MMKICLESVVLFTGTLLMFALTVTLTSGSCSFSSRVCLSPWFTQLDSSFHKNFRPLTQRLTFSWLDADKPRAVSSSGLTLIQCTSTDDI